MLLEGLLRMNHAERLQQVLGSLRALGELYVSECFASSLFDADDLDFAWANGEEPNDMPPEALPSAPISADRIQDALGDFWHHSAGRIYFYAYTRLDDDMRAEGAVQTYVRHAAQWDISQRVIQLCKTGEIYRTRQLPRVEVSIFTGTVELKLADAWYTLERQTDQHSDDEAYRAFLDDADH